jgi:hypothetical protein
MDATEDVNIAVHSGNLTATSHLASALVRRPSPH